MNRKIKRGDIYLADLNPIKGCEQGGIITLLDGLKNQPIIYDDIIVRQLIDCVRVISDSQLEIIFKGGDIVREVNF
jgi:hypothetical protein